MNTSASGAKMSADEINALIEEHFVGGGDKRRRLLAIETDGIVTRSMFPVRRHDQRAGGTVMGPRLMMVADGAAYHALLAHYGPVVGAYTTNLSINFLRAAFPENLISEARVIRGGRRLCVLDVTILPDPDDGQGPLAVSQVTYMLRPGK